MRKFITVREFAKRNKLHSSVVHYRLSNGHVPEKYLKVMKAKNKNRLIIGIREDAPCYIQKKEVSYSEARHTVYLPGGIKKVLEPREYTNTNWRK